MVRFPTGNDASNAGRALVSVKGGRTVNPGMVRDLVGVLDQERADIGLFICQKEPTSGMLDVARRSGDYTWPVDGRRFPRVQILTVSQLLVGTRPEMPTPFMPYLQAQRFAMAHPTLPGF
ncbi:MAG: restriction endonuclease [Chloroflexota bacterium]|nr:restriction endonuclease [Chloroflexota bacterium]